jgi:hypothetical protein
MSDEHPLKVVPDRDEALKGVAELVAKYPLRCLSTREGRKFADSTGPSPVLRLLREGVEVAFPG